MAIPVVHPGSILNRELEARGLSASRLALDIGVPSSRIFEIVRGRRAISPDTAFRLGIYLGTGGELWLNLQSQHDLALLNRTLGPAIRHEIRLPRTSGKNGSSKNGQISV